MSETSERRLPDGRIVYDPRGDVSAEPRPLAPRPASLDGLRLGILDNTKWNASKLLRQVVAQLEAGLAFSSVRVYSKSSFSRLAPPDVLDRIASEADVAITAIGD